MAQLIPYLLTCGPLALILTAWAKLYWSRPRDWPNRTAMIALCLVTINALIAATSFLSEQFNPNAASVPPWQDFAILSASLLFFLAPVGMIVAAVAAARGTPKWLVLMLEIASFPLFLLGIFASASV